MDTETRAEFGKIGGEFEKMHLEFRKIDARFEQIDKRFEQVDQRFDGIDQRFDGIDQRLEGIDTRFEQVDQRFDQVDNDISLVLMTVSKTYEEMDTEIKAINARMVTKDYLDRRLERFASANHLVLRDQGESYKP